MGSKAIDARQNAVRFRFAARRACGELTGFEDVNLEYRKERHIMKRVQLASYTATHFRYAVSGTIATITLDRPERKNPLTLESYGELRDLFREMAYATDIKAVVFTGAGANFCSGGDVHDIIGKLVEMDMADLLRFTRMTGDVVKALRSCPQPIIAAIDGVCTGAGAMIACAADIRLATERSKLAFLFVRVGLAAADMGACTLLPRLIGLSRAADWLYTGRVVGGAEAERAGFYSRLVDPDKLLEEATGLAASLADGPTFGHAMTKTMLWQEWSAGLGECIEAEAQAQAICMQTADFERAYRAFVAKQKPVFEGN